MKSRDSSVVNITDKEGQLTKANENYLWSSLSQSEELGALLTAGRIGEDPRGTNQVGSVASRGDWSAKMATGVGGGTAAGSEDCYWSSGRANKRFDWSRTTGQTCSGATDFDKGWYLGRTNYRPFLRIPLLQLDWPGEGDTRDSLKYFIRQIRLNSFRSIVAILLRLYK